MLKISSISRSPFVALKKKKTKNSFSSIAVDSHVKSSISVVKSDDDSLEIRFVQTQGTIHSINIDWPFSNESKICSFVTDCQRKELLVLTDHSCLMIFDLMPAISSLITNRAEEKIEIRRDFLRHAICQSARLSLPVVNSESARPICCKLWVNQFNQRVLCVGFSGGYVGIIDTQSLYGVYFRVSDFDIVSLGISATCNRLDEKSFVTLVCCSLNSIVSCTVLDVVSTDGSIARIVDRWATVSTNLDTLLWDLHGEPALDDCDRMSYLDISDESSFNKLLSSSSGYIVPASNDVIGDFMVPTAISHQTHHPAHPKCYFGIYCPKSEALHLFSLDLFHFERVASLQSLGPHIYNSPVNEELYGNNRHNKTAFQSLLQAIPLKLLNHSGLFATCPVSASIPISLLISRSVTEAGLCLACSISNSDEIMSSYRSKSWKCLRVGVTINYLHLMLVSNDGCLSLAAFCNLHGKLVQSMQLIRGNDNMTAIDRNELKREFVDFVSCRGRMLAEQDIVGSLFLSKMALLRNNRRPRTSDEMDEITCRNHLAEIMGSLEMERILPPTSLIIILRAAGIVVYENYFISTPSSSHEGFSESESVAADLWSLGYSPSNRINLGHPDLLALSKSDSASSNVEAQALSICKLLMNRSLINSSNPRTQYDLILFISRNMDYSVISWIEFLLGVFQFDETKLSLVVPLIFISAVSRNCVCETMSLLSRQKTSLLSLCDINFLLRTGNVRKFFRSCFTIGNSDCFDADVPMRFLSRLGDRFGTAIAMIIMMSLDFGGEHCDDMLYLLFRVTTTDALTLLLSCLCGHHKFDEDSALYDIYFKLNDASVESDNLNCQVSGWGANVVEIVVISLCLLCKLESSRNSSEIDCIVSSNTYGRQHVENESFAFNEIEHNITKLATSVDPSLCQSLTEFILSASLGTSLLFERNADRLLHILTIRFNGSQRLCGRIYEIEYDYSSSFSAYLMHVICFIQNVESYMIPSVTDILSNVSNSVTVVTFDNTIKQRQIATYLLSVLHRISLFSLMMDHQLAVEVTRKILKLWKLFMIPTDLLCDIIYPADSTSDRHDKPSCACDFLALAYFQNNEAKSYGLQFRASQTMILARRYFQLKQ